MTIDVSATADQIWTAFKGALGGAAASGAAAGKAEAQRLAQCLADIEAAKLVGQITEDQAKELVAGQLDASKAVLQAQLGVAELTANSALKAGLQVLVNTALGAAGLGWLVPILNSLAQTLQTAGVTGV